METKSSPSLLPILRSRQQAEVLTFLLCDPSREASISELSHRLDVPLSSVHREIERAEAAGLVASRRIGNIRLVRADTDSPYYGSLSDLLIKAFGPPQVLAETLKDLDGIDAAHIFGSWAARLHGVTGRRPVRDIDLLVIGEPDRNELYAALSGLHERLGREIDVTIRPAGWLQNGTDSFHATVTERPIVTINLTNRSPAAAQPASPPNGPAAAGPPSTSTPPPARAGTH